jgi:hypothetical protein
MIVALSVDMLGLYRVHSFGQILSPGGWDLSGRKNTAAQVKKSKRGG